MTIDSTNRPKSIKSIAQVLRQITVTKHTSIINKSHCRSRVNTSPCILDWLHPLLWGLPSRPPGTWNNSTYIHWNWVLVIDRTYSICRFLIVDVWLQWIGILINFNKHVTIFWFRINSFGSQKFKISTMLSRLIFDLFTKLSLVLKDDTIWLIGQPYAYLGFL